MNSLSWFVYLSSMIDVVIGWMIALGIVGTIGCVVSFIWWMITGCCPNDRDVQELLPMFKKFRRLSVSLLVFGVSLSVLLPSKQTLVLLAASQLGERIIQSEQVKGIVDPGLALVKTWIDTETARLKEQKEKK